MGHVVDGSEGGPERFRSLVHRALEIEAGAAPRRAEGRRAGAVFLNPSLRTRTSFEAACGILGVQPIVLQPGTDAWALEYRDGVRMDGLGVEHVRDAVGVLSGFVHLLAVRAFAGLADPDEDRADPVLAAFMRHSRVPVVNLESARWHPLQGLADAATWVRRLGPDLRGVPITLTWAPHPKALPTAVPNQVLLSAAMMGMDLTLAHPEGFDLDPEVVARASGLAASQGGAVRVTDDREAAFAGARVVVAKSWGGWSGYRRREDEANVRRTLGHWTVDAASMALTDRAGFMHCLPVRRNVVVTDEVIDGPDSWTQETGHRRLTTAVALLESLFSETSP
jgi:N-acetylornithine carbamoyltransferase